MPRASNRIVGDRCSFRAALRLPVLGEESPILRISQARKWESQMDSTFGNRDTLYSEACPLEQSPQPGTFVLSPACSRPATIWCCLGRRVVRPSINYSVIKDASPSGAGGQLHRGFRSRHSTFG